MTTEWPGIEHFFTDHLIIHGSSLSIQTVKQSSPYGSTNGGIHTGLLQTYCHQQHSRDSTTIYSKQKDYIILKQFSFTKNSKYHGSSAGAIKSPNIIALPTNSRWAYSESSKLNGGTNLTWLYAQSQQSTNSLALARKFISKSNRSLNELTPPQLQRSAPKLPSNSNVTQTRTQTMNSNNSFNFKNSRRCKNNSTDHKPTLYHPPPPLTQ